VNVADVMAVLVVVVAMPLNWTVVALLWRLHRQAPEVRVLRERGIVATALAIIVTVFALVFLNNDLDVPLLDFESTKLVTRSAILAASIIPALYWLSIYWRGPDPGAAYQEANRANAKLAELDNRLVEQGKRAEAEIARTDKHQEVQDERLDTVEDDATQVRV
jgi:hypothetical protein